MENKPVNLNVASGYCVLENFTNLDNRLFLKLSKSPFLNILFPFLSKEKKEIIGKFREVSKKAKLIRQDCRKKLKYEDAKVDHILCSHFLEHLYHYEVIKLLREVYRILRPGGTLHIILSDFECLVNQYTKSGNANVADLLVQEVLAYSKKGMSFSNRLLDMTGNYGLHHLWMYDRKSMSKKLVENGFKIEENIFTPSDSFRKEDESLHIFATKINDKI